MYSELIKVLCIRFIIEITYEDNIKNIRNVLSKETESSKQNYKNNIESENSVFK